MLCGNCGRDRTEGRCHCVPAEFWKHADVRAAVARGDVARVVRLLRRRTDLTQEAIATLTGLSQGMVSQMESGKRSLRNAAKRHRALEGLGVPHLVSQQRPSGGLESTAAPKPLTDLCLPGEERWASLPARGRRVGHSEAETLTARAHALRLADDHLAGKDLIVPARRELDTAIALHRDSVHSAAVGRALLVGIGELAQIVGWILSDAGQHAEAEQVYRLGLSAARQAQDSNLAGNLAGSLAYQWSNTGRERESRDLAVAALEEAGPDAHPAARALSWDRVAWTQARSGDVQAAIRSLGKAHEALAAPSSQEAPGWAYWVSEEELEVMDARVYTELRRPLRAVPVLSAVLDRYDATHTRELALYLSWLAIALIDANEPEHAAQVTARMLTLSAGVASQRTDQRTRVVLHRLQRFRRVPEVEELFVSLPESTTRP